MGEDEAVRSVRRCVGKGWHRGSVEGWCGVDGRARRRGRVRRGDVGGILREVRDEEGEKAKKVWHLR